MTTIDTIEGDEASVIEPVLDGDPAYLSEDDDTPLSGPAPLWAGVAIIAVLAWLGGMLWLARGIFAAPPAPIELVQFLAALCVPPALIGILWLLGMRTSRAEARRFGHTAQAMRAEAASLERTIAIMARQIEDNRERLAEQIDTLMAMGDRVATRLGTLRGDIEQEVASVSLHSRQLEASTGAAQQSLEVLFASLPRAHDETREMKATIEGLGLAASEQAAALDAQLAALADRGREADNVAGGAAQKLAAHIARMEATSETAGARLESVTGEMSNAVDGLLVRTAGAVDEARKGIATQGEAMLAMLETNQAALDRATRDSVEALSSRIAGIETMIDRLATRLGEQQATSEALLGGLDEGIGHVETRLATLHTEGLARNQELAGSISALSSSADAMTVSLQAGEDTARRVIGTAEDLLTALDASAREIDETLPEALARLDARIGESRGVVSGAKPELLALVTAAESTHDAIEAIAQVVQGQRTTLDQLSTKLLETLDAGRTKADTLGKMFDETIGRTNSFAEESAPKLVEALIRVRDTASAAAERARETLATVIPEAAQSLETASAEAMKRATDASVTRQVKALSSAADDAVAAAGRASDRLAEQMEALAAATVTINAQVENARAEREDAEQNSFARRAALLIEAMNSNSIDIAKTFSNEVSDSAWAAYLKGDRGVFTRRAVRLLDTTEAREIMSVYDADPDFREQVNRYIHDFESMLRAILNEREGSPLGVTLLSSDMGKLYVALAQAIERLRT
ncbi:hypothetical protein ACFO8O_04180 [Hephaestia sp. GCM10023244]|uniref:hypothetical protein n=1 Tax=Hephaestia sp. MAHUQ-44 TaxID=2952526 RepID=UPI002076FD59|nr:hypothetical protein [Hephaestia sp. MAHUQ-44]MCM8730167.1 hypothetical protein [Hephaestia sp. MAHUQ-44]